VGDLCVGIPVYCFMLKNPSDGEVMFRGNSFGATASYTCHSGFIMRGSRLLYCNSDGIWSHQPPTCKSDYCYTHECLKEYTMKPPKKDYLGEIYNQPILSLVEMMSFLVNLWY